MFYKTTLLTLLLNFLIYGQLNWEWQSPLPHGNHIKTSCPEEWGRCEFELY
jgi:hypothetical protein